MTRLLLDYMKSLRHRATDPEPNSAVLNGPEPTNFEIKITALGYSIHHGDQHPFWHRALYHLVFVRGHSSHPY